MPCLYSDLYLAHLTQSSCSFCTWWIFIYICCVFYKLCVQTSYLKVLDTMWDAIINLYCCSNFESRNRTAGFLSKRHLIIVHINLARLNAIIDHLPSTSIWGQYLFSNSIVPHLYLLQFDSWILIKPVSKIISHLNGRLSEYLALLQYFLVVKNRRLSLSSSFY